MTGQAAAQATSPVLGQAPDGDLASLKSQLGELRVQLAGLNVQWDGLKSQLDQMLRAAWSGLNNALVAGDKAGALRAFNGAAQLKFGPVFDVLMPFMGEIVASYSALAQSSLTNSIGEYAVARMDGTQRRVFMIYFLRGSDGVWKIDEM